MQHTYIDWESVLEVDRDAGVAALRDVLVDRLELLLAGVREVGESQIRARLCTHVVSAETNDEILCSRAAAACSPQAVGAPSHEVRSDDTRHTALARQVDLSVYAFSLDEDAATAAAFIPNADEGGVQPGGVATSAATLQLDADLEHNVHALALHKVQDAHSMSDVSTELSWIGTGGDDLLAAAASLDIPPSYFARLMNMHGVQTDVSAVHQSFHNHDDSLQVHSLGAPSKPIRVPSKSMVSSAITRAARGSIFL